MGRKIALEIVVDFPHDGKARKEAEVSEVLVELAQSPVIGFSMEIMIKLQRRNVIDFRRS